MWWGAVVGSAWLAATTLGCIAALARGNRRAAHRVAAWAPPLVRRLLQVALVSTWALVPAAAQAASPSAPVTVHVGAGGRLATGSERAAPSDVPVVRAPARTAPSPSDTTATAATTLPTTTTTTTGAPAAPQPSLPPMAGHSKAVARNAPLPTAHPVAPTPAGSIPVAGRVYVVRSGDNLWRIARAEVIRTSGVARPDDTHVAPYWRRVIAANRTTLRSGDPSLIFPGEVVTLPTG
jgi:nucleoid-associated protein YgaU